MIKRWWIRRKLKWHGICPDHGTPYGYGKGGKYCSGCDKDYWVGKDRKTKVLIAMLKEIDGN